MRLLALEFLCLVALSGPSVAQRSIAAPEHFLKDVDSVIDMPRVGAALYAEDPRKKTWQNYCGDSQTFAARGEFRLAVRAAAMALHIGDPRGSAVGGPYILATRDMANAYSLAGDHATALEWATRMLAGLDKGSSEEWIVQQANSLRATALHIRALALSHLGKHADAVTEIKRAQELLPYFGRGLFKSELRLALAAIELKAGRLSSASETMAPVLSESDPVLRLAAARVAGDIALAGNEPKKAVEIYVKALAAVTDGKDSFQTVMLQAGLARAHRLAGDVNAAGVSVQRALLALETLRAGFSSFEMRAALYGSHQHVFDEAVDLFVSRGDPISALAASEASRARAMLDLQGKVTKGASTFEAASVRPRSLPEIQAQLTGDQVLLVYHQLPLRMISWRITRNDITLQTHNITADQLRSEVSRFRNAIERNEQSVATIATTLSDILIAPIQLPEGVELIIAPHKALHLLPFQALRHGQKWLIERHPVATVLSASLLTANMSPSPPEVLVALGNPDLGGGEWALPGSEQEVRDIQELYARNHVFIRKEATKDRLMITAPNVDVVHVAAHAVVDDVDPMYSSIKLASVGLAGSALEARELAGLNLDRVQLITLSACNSGVGRVAHGDEFMGFKRAVLSAGARSALLSLWSVEDDSTRILMGEFYKAWKTDSKSRALRIAQLKLMAEAKYAAPFFWAAFTLVGSPS